MFAALRSKLSALSTKQQRVREEAFLGYYQRRHNWQRAKREARLFIKNFR